MKVMFCTPCYDSRLVVEFERSLDASMRLCRESGVEVDWTRISGDCYVHKARDILAADFLNSDCTDAFLIDSDMGWDVMAPLRLLAAPHEFVCGIYPFKEDTEGYPAKLKDSADGRPIAHPKTGYLAMDLAPTGFWRLRRSVFEKMLPLADQYVSQGRTLRNFFRTPIMDGQFFGEDTSFCRMWTTLGGEIWCDPNIDFEHVGRKIYRGNYGNFLNRAQAARDEYESWFAQDREIREAA